MMSTVSVFFFPAWKKKNPFRENSLIFLPIFTWKFRTYRENKLKCACETNDSVLEIFSCITCVKIVKIEREKYQFFYSFCTCEKRNPHVNIFKKYHYPPLENVNPYVKKSLKVVMKNFYLPWKLAKKFAWKRFFVREKNEKIGQKSVSRTFDFLAGKKTGSTLPIKRTYH